jgi:hypothetical protein
MCTEPLPSNDKGIHSTVLPSKLLLTLASKLILGSESDGTHDHAVVYCHTAMGAYREARLRCIYSYWQWGYAYRLTDCTLMWHGPRRKRSIQILYDCVYSLPRKLLPSRSLATVGETHTGTQPDGRELWTFPLRWAQMQWKTCRVSVKLVQVFKSWQVIHGHADSEVIS